MVCHCISPHQCHRMSPCTWKFQMRSSSPHPYDITCDSFKVLAKNALEELSDNQQKGPKILLFDL